MNHRFHKVIFSQSQQQFVVVSELVKSSGKSSALPKVQVDGLFLLLFDNIFSNSELHLQSQTWQNKAFQIYTHSEREKVTEAKLELGKAQAQKASKEEIGKLEANLDRLQKEFDKNYGTGSETKRAVEAVTAALQGLAAKDVGQAAVGLASPYLNAEIKKYTEGDTQANLIAHALLGAVEAAATGNNVLAGAAAGAGSEAAADFIVRTLYDGKSTQDLTEAEKQNVTLLSQLASGLASGLIGDSTQSAAVGADIGKRAVENNSLVVDRLRENKKADAEQWKLKVREKLGNNTASQFINGVIDVVEEGADSALFVGDTVFDTFALLTTCAVGDSYCNQAKIDLAGKNQAVSNTLNALMTGEYWEGVKAVAKQAYEGDQQALENFSGILTGLLLPTKVLPNNSKLSDFSKSVPKEINSGSKLPIFDEVVNYPENIHFNINLKTHLIEGEGINQRKGVIGAHNKENFINTLTQGGGRIVKEENSSVDGISHIHYEIPRLSRDGTPDGTYKAISSPKTVYDPYKLSDSYILEMGMRAAAKGYNSLLDKNKLDNNIRQDKFNIDGINYRFYLNHETKEINNVHPE
ncbi:VENN motif pre-toxin domain-containing protein [Glaesserella parasuis]|nr:VENN motif pre-toxin domain-containing protein [Glaesserella parasuis]MDP0272336.1 VENN motif pre-toxin domain-containing protein [Glaesserella parasuis]MDP0306152.1 VENN motif pre-toxin domain-containing protein [Glaesserella parasuis]MDP0470857.1 VENN motif pre-toxin domain-containing protein [Glaesserella parasuis]